MKKFSLIVLLVILTSCSFGFTSNKKFYDNYDRYWTFEIELDGIIIKYCAFQTKQQYENCFHYCLEKEYDIISFVSRRTQFRLISSLDEKLKQKMRSGGFEYVITVYNKRLEVYRRIGNAFYIGDL